MGSEHFISHFCDQMWREKYKWKNNCIVNKLLWNDTNSRFFDILIAWILWYSQYVVIIRHFYTGNSLENSTLKVNLFALLYLDDESSPRSLSLATELFTKDGEKSREVVETMATSIPGFLFFPSLAVANKGHAANEKVAANKLSCCKLNKVTENLK